MSPATFTDGETSPTAQPSADPLAETVSRSQPGISISNVLVISPSITRGFQPKNYNPPAYTNIGRSPSLPSADIFGGQGKENLARSRLSIAYGHAASHQYKDEHVATAGEEESSTFTGNLPRGFGESATPPHAISSGSLSPAARKEITAQLSVPITPNSLPSDARRQSISTLLPAGVMSAKLSQLILEEEEANQREQAKLSGIGIGSRGHTGPMGVGAEHYSGRPETIPENVSEVENQSATLKQRPYGLSRSTSNSVDTSPIVPQINKSRPARRNRSRPQTSAAAFSGTSDVPPAFGAKSAKPLALTALQSEATRASADRRQDQKRPRAAVTGKPGWEGEEMVNILREDGIQVSTLRTASQLHQYISQIHALPMATGDASADNKNKTAQVIMVPLSDSPTLPSLSLLLTQGTTPSAICFQQDLLDRARRTEADWLPSALYIIGEAIEQSRDLSKQQKGVGQTYVIAYSANPALSPSVVERCMQAGAIGVLQPPYENRDTLKLIKKMIAYEEKSNAARHAFDHLESRRASVASGLLSSDSESTNTHSQRKRSFQPLSPLPMESTAEYRVNEDVESPSPYISDLAARRRSVDTGGLSLALERASRHVMSYESNNRSLRPGDAAGHWRVGQFREARATADSPYGSSNLGDRDAKIKTDRSASVADVGSHLAQQLEQSTIQEQEEEQMAVAELLSEMYRQTRVAIEIQMEDYDDFAAPISPEHRERLIQSLASWEFKPHLLSDEDLFHCACLLFEAVLSIHGLNELGVEPDQLHRFLFAIRAIYHAPNPYHNYVHAVDVLQATYTFLVANGVAPPVTYLLDANLKPWVRQDIDESENEEHDNARLAFHDLLRPQDILTVMIGAMGHDVGHPGLSNVFMKNAKTPLSQIYSDKSVLENMHCILVVQLLRKHGFGFLLTGSAQASAETGLTVEADATVSSDSSPLSGLFPNILPASAYRQSFKRNVKPGAVGDWRGFKKLLYATVLSTDMSLHFEWLKRFKDLSKRARAGLCADMTEEEETAARTLICQALIKCADISNPTRPIEVSEYWSTVLLDEWAVQASLERKLNLPISVVASADALIQAKGQIGFIDLFTLPLYEAATDAMPDLRYFADQCVTNRALWQARYDTLQAIAGDPSPIARTPITERNIPSGEAPEERYKMLFPLSIPTSLLDEQLSPLSNKDAYFPAPSHATSITSETPLRTDTQSVQTATPTDPEFTNALGKLKSANSDIRTLRAAYQASIKRHPSNSFRYYQSTRGRDSSSIRVNLEK